MSSDDEDDLFGSSGDDTDALIADAKKKAAPIAKKKPKRLQKKSAVKKRKRDSKIPDADDGSSDEDEGLFDDSDDEKEKESKKKPMSKKERMEALQAKKRQEMGIVDEKKKRPKKKKTDGGEEEEKGYDSGDSYNSAEYVRTQEDNDFIDADDDDPDAVKELYAEQHFDDERPDGSDDNEDMPKKKKKKGSSKSRAKGPDALSDNEDDDNPIMAAVRRMKKKKKKEVKAIELEEEAKSFLNKMEAAAEEDEKAVEERRPATKKLQMLNEVLDMLARQDILRILLDFDLLMFCKRWIQPLPNGSLGNITVRSKIIHAVSKMNGENGITSDDLKRSAFGKVVMTLYMHKSETPAMKQQLKKLIEQWSRPIFRKSGDLRDLNVAERSQGGLVGIAMAHQQQQQALEAAAKGSAAKKEQDLQSLIASGSKGTRDLGTNRVQIPYSKGMHYTKAPSARTGVVKDSRLSSGARENRSRLNKRMIEKGRASTKNQRSANISIEGRPTK